MNSLDLVPEPVLFNGLKHHLGYIRKFVGNHLTTSTQELAYELLCLGESQMDIYTGNMSPAEIAHEIILQLQQTGRFNKRIYVDFLYEQQAGYATLQLSDGTDWILRLGELEYRYIHIHPGRYAAHTLRVKAGALKTAIALSVWTKKYLIKEISLDLVNQVRKEVLHASPIKSLSTSAGIEKLIQLINPYY